MISSKLHISAVPLEAKHSFADILKTLSEIIKLRITAMVSFTTGLGYILASESVTIALFFPIIGIFFLACASSALNHYQEKGSDALMNRTSGRPIPSGRVEPPYVLASSLVLLAAGSVFLYLTTNVLTLAVGLFTFVWYNFVYTPLKKKSAFAIIPGALVGALPPAAGWAAGGGELLDPKLLIIASYFFVWQIPHFWLLLMLYGKDYERGGFPTLNRIMSEEQIRRVTFVWLIVNVAVAVLIPLFGIVNYGITGIIVLAMSAWMIWYSVRFLKELTSVQIVRGTFIRINFFTLMLITVLSADKILKSILT